METVGHTGAVGFSKTRLSRMHQVLSAHVQSGGIPGLVALAYRHGDVHAEVIGNKAEGVDDPIRRDSIFRISSMSKPITAAAAMILIEECKLRLDDPVDALLPELANRRVLERIDGPLTKTVPAKRAITVRDLLTYRMGFGQLMAAPDAYPILRAANELQIGMGPPQPGEMPAPHEWLTRLSTLPLMHQPGERWMYNTSADVLSVLIARASGQALETFLRERLFEPLGMKDTSFSVPANKMERFVTAYGTNFKTGAREVFDPAEGGQWSRPPAFPSGAAGLVSTADDYLAFGRMMLSKGRNESKPGSGRILSRLSVEAMTTNQITQAEKEGSELFLADDRGWGLGLCVFTQRDDVSAVPGRFGWDGGLGSSGHIDPHEDLVGVLMTQVAWSAPVAPPVCQDFWTCAYQAIDD